jgi:hypothetical protein
LYPPLKNATKGVHLKKGWKHSRIWGKGECIVQANEQSPFNYINFTGDISVWT